MASSSCRLAACLLLMATVGVSGGVITNNDNNNIDDNTNQHQQQYDRIADDGANTAPCPECQQQRLLPPTHLTPADMHVLRLEAIKAQLLRKLRLEHRPNVSIDVPRHVLLETVYRSGGDESVENEPNKVQDVSEDDTLRYTSEIITFAAPGPMFNNHTLLEFNQSDIDPESLRVTEAMLWVYVHKINFHHQPQRRKNGARHPKTILWVFRVPPDPPNTVHNPHHLIGSQQVRMQQRTGWQPINITDAARRWFTQPGENLRLLVDCSSCNGQIEAVFFNNQKHKGAHKPDSRRLEAVHRPFLTTRTIPSPARRMARRALQCDKNSKHCCKEEFYVSFSELGWDDWILAPNGYHANYCRGSCASIFQTPDSFNSMYAHLLEEMRRVREPDSITHCCAPTRFSPMTLIYLDEHGSIIKRDVPRMVVEECGCA